MYFMVGPIEYNEKFSYIISKNPSTVFERDLGNGRKIIAKFDDNKRMTGGYVENDSLIFLETAKKMNMQNYLHVQPWAVCPHNLKGFDTYFRSSIRGKNSNLENVSNDEFFKPLMLEAILGPFPVKFDRLYKIFKDVNIEIDIIPDDYTGKDKIFNIKENKEIGAYMVNFKTISPMSVTEFLQKIYLFSYYITCMYKLTKISEEQITKFVTLCSSWLEQSHYRNSIINTLCKNNKKLIEKFEIKLLDKEKDLDQIERENRLTDLQKFLTKERLHEKRHNLIVDVLQSANKEHPVKKIVDLGCGRGNLLSKIIKSIAIKKDEEDAVDIRKSKVDDSIKILAIDSNHVAIDTIKRKLPKNVKAINTNLTCPYLRDTSFLLPDFLIMSEVIEHLNKTDRTKAINIIKYLFQPEKFIITTPNKDYNFNFDLIDGIRHPDHKIEYTRQELEEEIIKPLSENYDIEFLKILDDKDPQITFIVYGKHKDPDKRTINTSLLNKINNMYSEFYLDISNYTIFSKEISNGYSSRQMMNYGHDIFYLAPTIAPVEYSLEKPDYLEHPIGCFDYYRSKGIYQIVGEEKYMGSRGYALVFRDSEIAKKVGFDKPIIINSRQGYPFFDNDEILYKIYKDIQPKLKFDFVMLDCEILPWSIKAKGLIDYSFKLPGECCYLSRKYGNYSNLKNANSFLNTLKLFSKDDDFSIKIFQILAFGNYDPKHNRFINYTNGFILNKYLNYCFIEDLSNNIFTPVKHHTVNLGDPESINKNINEWENYCKNGGEGFVYKPVNPITYSNNGYLIQPDIKVRGKDYLRLVYGIDYLNPDYFDKIKNRNIKRKRILAIKEFELSMKILRSFLFLNKKELYKLVAAFIGMENKFISNIDATL